MFRNFLQEAIICLIILQSLEKFSIYMVQIYTIPVLPRSCLSWFTVKCWTIQAWITDNVMRPQPNWSPKTSTEIIMLPKYSLSEIFEASIYTSWGRKKMEQTLQWMMLNMENVTPGQHKKPIKIWQNLILSHLKIHLLIFSKSYIHFLVYNYRGEIGPETQSRTLTTLIFL